MASPNPQPGAGQVLHVASYISMLHSYAWATGEILFALVHPHLFIDYNGQHQPPTMGGNTYNILNLQTDYRCDNFCYSMQRKVNKKMQ